MQLEGMLASFLLRLKIASPGNSWTRAGSRAPPWTGISANVLKWPWSLQSMQRTYRYAVCTFLPCDITTNGSNHVFVFVSLFCRVIFETSRSHFQTSSAASSVSLGLRIAPAALASACNSGYNVWNKSLCFVETLKCSFIHDCISRHQDADLNGPHGKFSQCKRSYTSAHKPASCNASLTSFHMRWKGSGKGHSRVFAP